MILGAFDTVLQIGLLYSLVAVGVVFAFRVVGFPDLTPDGSFTLGASTAAVLELHGAPAWEAMLLATTCGAIAGAFTALLHTRLGIAKLLSGILSALILYSISLRVMGTPNLSLLESHSFIGSLIQRTGSPVPILTVLTLCMGLGTAAWALLRTRIGLELRATGDSETALSLRGIDRERNYLLGLAVANGVTAWAGSVIASYQGFADVSMGIGIVVTCLAAIVIGETILRPQRIATLLLAPVAGMLIYQGIVAIALQLGFAPADLKVSTAMMTIVFVGYDRFRTQRGVGRQIGCRIF